ncbi:MAG: nuclear transport factor 2 family protein [Acidimicrobiales bacterium]
MADRDYNLREIQDRCAIEDLYDRQLAAAEAWDLASYDTTFAATAEIDLRDFGQPVRKYGQYRDWLESLRTVMVKAQRTTGGLRLHLDGDRATTRVPVVCYVTMEIDGVRNLTCTGLFYNDTLGRSADGWRIVQRHEELAWSGAPGPHN